jgi:hypothetical protein
VILITASPDWPAEICTGCAATFTTPSDVILCGEGDAPAFAAGSVTEFEPLREQAETTNKSVKQ